MFNTTELYDLDADPFESEDLIHALPSVAASLASRVSGLLDGIAKPSLCVQRASARTRSPLHSEDLGCLCIRYRDPDTGFVIAQYIWFARHGCAVTPWGTGSTPWGARPNTTTEHDPKYDEEDLSEVGR